MAIGGKILIDCLLAHGAKRGFGIPGESYLAVLDAFYDKKEDFNFEAPKYPKIKNAKIITLTSLFLSAFSIIVFKSFMNSRLKVFCWSGLLRVIFKILSLRSSIIKSLIY